MIKYEIKNRFTGAVQFTAEIDCDESESISVKVGLAVKWAIKRGANLSGAYLSGAYLSRADLSGANLSGAYLSRADLSDANLSDANLSRADLSDAYLSRADLSDAYLSRADLSGANLSDANLSRAYLSRAYLSGSNLIDGGQRSDGYRFVGWIKNGVLQIGAGCRKLGISEARAHWLATRAGTPLGDETTAILDHIETVARIRGLVKP